MSAKKLKKYAGLVAVARSYFRAGETLTPTEQAEIVNALADCLTEIESSKK